ncbi:MAG: hypothetical protein AB4042_09675 [Leptolyngbyaceae cyanobacterium]
MSDAQDFHQQKGWRDRTTLISNLIDKVMEVGTSTFPNPETQ